MANIGKNDQELLREIAVNSGVVSSTDPSRYLRKELANLLVGTTNLSTQDALNVWAGTTGLSVQGALNAKAGTTGLSSQDALEILASGPSGISNLGLWISADSGAYTDAGTTLATNGQTVQQWNDRSGNGNHFSQGTAGSRPTYVTNVQNGKPAIRFAADFMTNSSIVGTTGRTIFAVIKGTDATGNNLRFFSTNHTSGCVFGNTTSYGYYAKADTTVQAIGGTITNTASITIVYGPVTTEARIYLDGTDVSGLFDPFGSTTDGYLATGFTLAAESNSVTTSNKNCDIYEIIVYNRNVTTAERNTVHAYLASKWGITIA